MATAAPGTKRVYHKTVESNVNKYAVGVNPRDGIYSRTYFKPSSFQIHMETQFHENELKRRALYVVKQKSPRHACNYYGVKLPPINVSERIIDDYEPGIACKTFTGSSDSNFPILSIKNNSKSEMQLRFEAGESFYSNIKQKRLLCSEMTHRTDRFYYLQGGKQTLISRNSDPMSQRSQNTNVQRPKAGDNMQNENRAKNLSKEGRVNATNVVIPNGQNIEDAAESATNTEVIHDNLIEADKDIGDSYKMQNVESEIQAENLDGNFREAKDEVVNASDNEDCRGQSEDARENDVKRESSESLAIEASRPNDEITQQEMNVTNNIESHNHVDVQTDNDIQRENPGLNEEDGGVLNASGEEYEVEVNEKSEIDSLREKSLNESN